MLFGKQRLIQTKSKITKSRVGRTPLNRARQRKPVVAVVVIFVVVAGFLLLRLSRASGFTDFMDISSPQCTMSASKGVHQIGIVGLNGTYMAFGVNNCVVDQVTLFGTYDLYVGANYPSSHCPNMTPYNCGVAAAMYNLNLIKFFSLHPTKLWIDVETGPNITWSSPANNWSYLAGMRDTMKRQFAVGFYSNQAMWQQITGGIDLRQKGDTSWNWYASGRTTPEAARMYCGVTFGNSPNQYVQYVANGTLDMNVGC